MKKDKILRRGADGRFRSDAAVSEDSDHEGGGAAASGSKKRVRSESSEEEKKRASGSKKRVRSESSEEEKKRAFFRKKRACVEGSPAKKPPVKKSAPRGKMATRNRSSSSSSSSPKDRSREPKNRSSDRKGGGNKNPSSDSDDSEHLDYNRGLHQKYGKNREPSKINPEDEVAHYPALFSDGEEDFPEFVEDKRLSSKKKESSCKSRQRAYSRGGGKARSEYGGVVSSSSDGEESDEHGSSVGWKKVRKQAAKIKSETLRQSRRAVPPLHPALAKYHSASGAGGAASSSRFGWSAAASSFPTGVPLGGASAGASSAARPAGRPIGRGGLPSGLPLPSRSVDNAGDFVDDCDSPTAPKKLEPGALNNNPKLPSAYSPLFDPKSKRLFQDMKPAHRGPRFDAGRPMAADGRHAKVLGSIADEQPLKAGSPLFALIIEYAGNYDGYLPSVHDDVIGVYSSVQAANAALLECLARYAFKPEYAEKMWQVENDCVPDRLVDFEVGFFGRGEGRKWAMWSVSWFLLVRTIMSVVSMSWDNTFLSFGQYKNTLCLWT